MSLTRWNLLSATCRYGLCGGALYWTSVKGFWGGFCESQNLYCGTNKYVITQVRQLEWRYGIKILRDEEQIKRELRYNATTFWNIGIQKTFYFLSNMRIILSEQYDNIMSGKFMGKEEDDELEPAEYDDEEEEEEEEEVEIKKEETAVKAVNAKNDKNGDVGTKKDKVEATGAVKKVDASGPSANPEPVSDKSKINAALLQDPETAEKKRLLEEKIRADPTGKKDKIVEKIKKIHGM